MTPEEERAALVSFLQDRFADDEADAEEAAGIDGGSEYGDREWCPDWLHGGIRHLVRNCDIECLTHEDSVHLCGRPHRYAGKHVARHDPARVLAECRAKRRLVEELGAFRRGAALRLLAMPYADHPDYRQEWKP